MSTDPNSEAARVVRDSTKGDEPMPADLEAAWNEWSKAIKGLDERGWELLRAAFEAGVEAGQKAFAASGGRAGGKARAENLTAEQRSKIAKNAAKKRWGGED